MSSLSPVSRNTGGNRAIDHATARRRLNGTYPNPSRQGHHRYVERTGIEPTMMTSYVQCLRVNSPGHWSIGMYSFVLITMWFAGTFWVTVAFAAM